MRSRHFLLLALSPAVLAAAPARAQYVVAPDVVVFCEPTLQRTLEDIGALWRGETGIHLRIFTSPTWAELEQISHRARSDVVLGAGDDMAASATARELVKPGTLQRIWRNRLVAATTSAAIAKAEAASPPLTLDLAALAGKEPIAIVDPPVAVAGAEGKKALEALGLWDAVSSKSVGVVDTADAAFLLEHGTVQLALLYATDAAANPDFAVTDKLPGANDGAAVYWVAAAHNALSANAEKFIAFLREPAAAGQARADGLEVLP